MLKTLKLLTLALLLTLSINCTITSPQANQSVKQDTLIPRELPLHRKLLDLQLSVARFEWWITEDNNWNKIAHGTAFCIGRNEKDSLWITARHVADEPDYFKFFKLKHQSFINYYDGFSSVLYEVGNIYLSSKQDVACFVVQNFKPLSHLKLAQSSNYLENSDKRKDILVGCGFPNDIYPGFWSVGLFRGRDVDGIIHSCSSWYGNSGGPICDFNTFEVVAIVTKFNHWPPPMSNDHWSTKVERVRDLLKELEENK